MTSSRWGGMVNSTRSRKSLAGFASTLVAGVIWSMNESHGPRTSPLAPARVAVDPASQRLRAGFGPFAKVTRRLNRWESSSEWSGTETYGTDACKLRMTWFLSDESSIWDTKAMWETFREMAK